MDMKYRKILNNFTPKIFLISAYNILHILTLSPKTAEKTSFNGFLIEFRSYLEYNTLINQDMGVSEHRNIFNDFRSSKKVRLVCERLFLWNRIKVAR